MKKESKHKYSTYVLIILISIIILSILVSALTSSDLDEVCGENNKVLYRSDGTWTCAGFLTVIGDLYYHNDSTPLTVSIPVVDTYYKVTGMNEGLEKNVNVTNDSIIIQYDGDYYVTATLSFSGGAGQVYEIELFINDASTSEGCEFHRKIGTGGDVGSASLSCDLELIAGDVLDLRVEDETNPTADIDITTIKFIVQKVGAFDQDSLTLNDYYNKTETSSLFAPINYGDNWNKTYADTLYASISSTSLWTNSSGNATFTSGNVGIGTNSPVVELQVQGNIYNNGTLSIGKVSQTNFDLQIADEDSSANIKVLVYSDTSSGHSGRWTSEVFGGTIASPSAINNGRTMGSFRFNGAYNSTAVTTGAIFRVISTEAWNSTNKGTSFVFEGTPTGSASRSEWMRLTGDGSVGIGTISPTTRLYVSDSSIDGDVFTIKDSDGTCSMNPESGAITTTCTSDERLKRNVQDVNKTEVLEYLKVWSVCMKEYEIIASGDIMIGPIAQCVQEYLPELVNEVTILESYDIIEIEEQFLINKTKEVYDENNNLIIINYTELITDTHEEIINEVYETYLTVNQPDTNRLLIGAVELYKRNQELETNQRLMAKEMCQETNIAWSWC